ncbi:MAG: hypothetical protein U1F41_05370 [Burkholderiales bacterium]
MLGRRGASAATAGEPAVHRTPIAGSSSHSLDHFEESRRVARRSSVFIAHYLLRMLI